MRIIKVPRPWRRERRRRHTINRFHDEEPGQTTLMKLYGGVASHKFPAIILIYAYVARHAIPDKTTATPREDGDIRADIRSLRADLYSSNLRLIL